MNFIKFDLEGSIGTITLNRPPVNSLNMQVYKEIKDTFLMINNDKDIRVVIFKAEGKIFSAGNDVNDIASISSNNYFDYMKHIKECFSTIYNCRVPVIAALSGVAVGAGMVLVASCDFILASENAKVGIPEIDVGLVGGGEGPSRLVPHKVVRYLALTGETLSASELKHYGGVLDVVSKDELIGQVAELAKKIANKSPLAIEQWKQNLNKIEVYNKVDDDSDIRTLSIIDKEDTKEAALAFLEKRKPKFKRQ